MYFSDNQQNDFDMCQFDKINNTTPDNKPAKRIEPSIDGSQEVDFDFGDKRLNERGKEMCMKVPEKNTVVLRQMADDRNEEVSYGRFLANPNVTREALIEGITGHTAKQCANRHILHIEDSSQLNYDIVKDKVSGLGTIANGSKQGFFIHPTLAVDADYGGIIGISAFKAWNREDYQENKELTHWQHSQLPIQQKESYRWIESAQYAVENCESASMNTIITDREGDIYDTFHKIPNPNTHVLIRSSNNRLLYDQDEKLFEYTDTLEVRHTYELDLPATDKRSAHTAKMDVRFDKVKLARPKNFWDKSAPDSIQLYVVDVRENDETVNPGEEPVHWRLLTTHQVLTVADALRIIDWYCWRWWIEQLFRTLKNKGLQIENSQVEDYERLVKLTIIGMIGCVRALQLTAAREGRTNQPLTDVFSNDEILLLHTLCTKLEGRTKKLKNPFEPEQLAYGSWIIGRLGGWSGYASQRPPGPIVIFRGLTKYQNLLEGWLLAQTQE